MMTDESRTKNDRVDLQEGSVLPATQLSAPMPKVSPPKPSKPKPSKEQDTRS